MQKKCQNYKLQIQQSQYPITTMQPSDPLQSQKRDPVHRKQEQVQKNSKPRKRQKKQSQNPFDNLMLIDEEQQQQKQKNGEKNTFQSEWIKPKTTPLTVSVVDHSRINKYYSHKSLQKYIRYLFLKSCPNPMWLSIKRQSQVEHITFIDIEIQNDLFHYWMSKKWQAKATNQLQQNIQQISKNTENHIKQSTQLKQNGNNKQKLKQEENEDEDHLLKFLSQYNQPEVKAVFKQSPFLKESYEVWESLLIYDEEAVKEEINNLNCHEQLPNQLTKQLFELYNTYTLSEDQLKYNLYPIIQLPVYKGYFKILPFEKQLEPHISQVLQSEPQQDQKSRTLPANKILIIDCEMVMSGNNFQLARTSIMNFKGQLIYDQFFKPDSVITNYNTQFSGITEETLKGVDKTIADLHEDLKNIVAEDTILVGHSLQNDFHAMKFMHDKVIDTSVLYARKNGSKMKLKTLAFNILKRQIQVGSHCSSEDCKATLDLMRVKIEQNQQSSETKTYHMLNQLQENEKKVVLIDNNIDFIKHRKQYLGVHFQDVEYCPENRQHFLGNFVKYFNKNVRNPELVLARMRRSQVEEWEQYYKNMDETIQKLYQASPDKNIFFLNFQVNNSFEIYPRKMEDMLDKRRPFCLLLVKSN